MKTWILIAFVSLAASCSATSAMAPVLDAASLMQAAGVGADCMGAKTVTVAPAFEVDWSGSGATYGGGVFLGCASKLFQFRCAQESPVIPGDKAEWKCEPLGFWVKQ